MSASGPLSGRTVVVTRAAEQAGSFVASLEALGASVLEVPVIRIVDPFDGGAGLRAAVDHMHAYDWVVLASPNAAARFAGSVGSSGLSLGDLRVAVVGPGTAAVLREFGLAVDLVADRSVGEGLVEAFPAGSGRVLLPRAAVTRDVIASGLAAKGWEVDEVEAYRTEPRPADPALANQTAAADAIAFTSSSTVRAFVSSLGVGAVPPIVVSIGPETTRTLQSLGVEPTATADPHTLDSLVGALVGALRSSLE